jgi:hypothetical protein
MVLITFILVNIKLASNRLNAIVVPRQVDILTTTEIMVQLGWQELS